MLNSVVNVFVRLVGKDDGIRSILLVVVVGLVHWCKSWQKSSADEAVMGVRLHQYIYVDVTNALLATTSLCLPLMADLGIRRLDNCVKLCKNASRPIKS